MKAPKDIDKYMWSVTYTTNGEDWTTDMFQSFATVRAAVRELEGMHARKPGFTYFVERRTLVHVADLLDDDVEEADVRLIVNRRLVGGAE